MADLLGNLDVVILAGGLGTRLRSIVAGRPKILAEVNGKPFLTYLLDSVADTGVKKVILCTGYLAEQVEDVLGCTYRSVNLLYSRESFPLGTGGGLRLALHYLEGNSALVMNGDSYCDADLPSFWSWHTGCGSEATLLLVKVSNVARYGRVEIDHNGKIVAFEEKAKESGPGLINAGVYLLSRNFIASIPKNRPVSLEREIFPIWVSKGLHGYRCTGYFLDVGTAETYALAGKFFEHLKRNRP